MPALLPRHTISAAVSVILQSIAYILLARQGQLGDLVPAEDPYRPAALGALSITFGYFLPFALAFELTPVLRRRPPWVAPVAMFAFTTCAVIVFDIATHEYHHSILTGYALLGLLVALAFCTYWIPLKFLARPATPSPQ